MTGVDDASWVRGLRHVLYYILKMQSSDMPRKFAAHHVESGTFRVGRVMNDGLQYIEASC